ncbi:MAG: sugar phosphate isomerase/epimerase [Gemmataceae bacterium]|nr:sugar phosphate isomerase/epimerase [Gemmataceae bacterium]MDW8267028.1 sugar phosphate isomerase/epimerase [Gemmataceae bacterium]
MKPCISQATTLPTSFADDVRAYARAGCHALEVWLTKLETHLARHSGAETRRLLDDQGMTLTAAAYQGGLLLAQGEQRKAHYDHFRRRLDICQQLGIPILLVVADFADKVDVAAWDRAVASLRQAAQWAAGFDVRLALEFRGRGTFCSSLDTALSLVAQCGEPNVGINLDVFHYYIGPSKFEDLGLLTADRLAYVQVADLAGTPRELATDADRILPGEGDFRLGPIMERLRTLGYDGWVSLELMNPTLWQVPPEQVAELGLAALQRLLTSPK